MSKALNLRLRKEHELTMRKKEDAILRRIVTTDILHVTISPRDSADLPSCNRRAALRLLHVTWLGTPSNTARPSLSCGSLDDVDMARIAKLSPIRSHSL